MLTVQAAVLQDVENSQGGHDDEVHFHSRPFAHLGQLMRAKLTQRLWEVFEFSLDMMLLVEVLGVLYGNLVLVNRHDDNRSWLSSLSLFTESQIIR